MHVAPWTGWRKRRREARVELLLQQRQQEPANAVSREAQVGVAEVAREVEIALDQEAADVRAAHAEERAEKPPARGSHRAEAPTSAAAQEAKEHGLHLIVLRVAGHDVSRADLGRHRRERAVACTPGACLDAGIQPVILDSLVTGRAEFVAERRFYHGDIADGDLLDRIFAEHARVTRSVAFPGEILVFGAAGSRLLEFIAEISFIVIALAVFHHHTVPASFGLRLLPSFV